MIAEIKNAQHKPRIKNAQFIFYYDIKIFNTFFNVLEKTG